MTIIALDGLAQERIIHAVADGPANRANEANRHGGWSVVRNPGRHSIQITGMKVISQFLESAPFDLARSVR